MEGRTMAAVGAVREPRRSKFVERWQVRMRRGPQVAVTRRGWLGALGGLASLAAGAAPAALAACGATQQAGTR